MNLVQQLEGLFREVSVAHHPDCIEMDGADPEWPLWYADFLRESLGVFLDVSFTKSELVYLLLWGTNE